MNFSTRDILKSVHSANGTLESVNQTPAWILYEKALTTWCFITVALAIVGAILFILLLTVLIRCKSYRTGCGLLIFLHILLELSMVTIYIPLNVLNIYLGRYNLFSPSECAAIHFTFVTTMNAANWSQLSLAVNRFAATLYPRFYRHLVSGPGLFGMILSTWGIALGTNIPKLFNVEGAYGVDRTWGTCHFVPTNIGLHAKLALAVGVYIPGALLIVLYLVIFLRTRYRKSSVTDYQITVEQNRRLRKRMLTCRILFASSLWYCACYYPQTILGALRIAAYERSTGGLQLWLRTLYLCGYLMTPIFFFALNREYRTGLRSTLRKIVS